MYYRKPWQHKSKTRRRRVGEPLPFEDIQKITKHLRAKEKEEFESFEEGYDDLVENAFEDDEKPNEKK